MDRHDPQAIPNTLPAPRELGRDGRYLLLRLLLLLDHTKGGYRQQFMTARTMI